MQYRTIKTSANQSGSALQHGWQESAALAVTAATRVVPLLLRPIETPFCPLFVWPTQVVDFAEALSPREVLFWHVFFEHLLASCKTAADVSAFFRR